MTHSSSLQILLLADTHLGFDHPIRPRAERRRRGPDFLASFRRVLAAAVEERPDLVVHGGDLFFRSEVPRAIVDLVYGELLTFADHGIPLVIVPGNHERSQLPSSLFLRHPNIHVFDRPSTLRFELKGARVALAGFPSVRRNVRSSFRQLLIDTGWEDEPADIRLLCLHQTIEGARVGPNGYTFRSGHDVIPQRDLPSSCHAVLAGHIHRHQILQVDPKGGRLLPVIYPGSTERTSFAEAKETKGYCLLDFDSAQGGQWALRKTEFVPLPTRSMVTVELPVSLTPGAVDGFLADVTRKAPPDAVLRFTCSQSVSRAVRKAFTSARLAACLPPSINVQFGSGFFVRRGQEPKP